MRRFPFQRIHFKLSTFQTETCSGGINISILAACLSDKLSGQTNGLQGGPHTPIQDRSSSEDLPQSHNPLPLCKYSFIVQYCSNIPQPLPFIEQEKDVLILIMMQIIIAMIYISFVIHNSIFLLIEKYRRVYRSLLADCC